MCWNGKRSSGRTRTTRTSWSWPKVKAETPVGLKAKDIMARGDLVSDDIVIAVAEQRLAAPDARRGFILDGFPRTVPQAEALDKMLGEKGLKLDHVIEMKVDDAAMVDRISGRYTCAKCGTGYHDKFRPTKVDGVCDVCGSTEFKRRPDDNEQTVRTRMEEYRAKTAPILPFYEAKGLVRRVDGMASVEAVGSQIDAILDGSG